MSLKNKLDEIARYVCDEYPELDFNEITLTHECVNRICLTVLKTTNKNVKKNIVIALKRDNSELRKLIQLLKGSNESVSFSSLKVMKIAKVIEEKKFTRKDFERLDTNIINEICRQLKVAINIKNRDSMYRVCKKIFNETNSYTILKDSISNVNSDFSEMKEISKVCIENVNRVSVCDSVDNNIESICEVNVNDSLNSSNELKSVNFENVVNSTPIANKIVINTPIKRSNEKYEKVESPLREALTKRTPVKSGVVLPPGAENRFPDSESCRENNYKKFRGCTYKEGEFTIAEEQWSLLKRKNDQNNNRFNKSKYPIILRKYIRCVNNTCVFNVASAHYPKNTYSYVYMYCSHPGCKTFKLIVKPQTNRSVIVDVWSSSLHYYHNPAYALTNHVRGIERDLVRGTLKKTKVFTYDDEAVKSISPSKHARGNNQKVKSVDVLRRIRSEAISADDYDRDDMLDLLLMYRENSDYVRHVGLPAYVHIYSVAQLDLMTKLKLNAGGTVTGYLDATGTVVRKASDDSKRVLYYGMVIQAPLPGNSSVTCPILEMISSSHDIITISQWLNAFKAFVLKSKQSWPLFANVVTDFSYAQMHALCIGWNGFSSIFDYLNWCYDVLFKNKDGSNMTIINVCVNHYTKIIVNHVYTNLKFGYDSMKSVEMKRINNCVIDWICLLFNMESIEDILQWFRWLSVVLLSKTKTQEMKNAFHMLQNKCKDNYGQFNCEREGDSSFNSVIDEDLCETLTSKSLMYCKFQYLKEDTKIRVNRQVTNVTELNEYYNEEYLNSFILKCVPFIPLWTPVMNIKANNGVCVRQSNAIVESWFKTVKIDMLGSNRRLKCGRFVKVTRDRVVNVCKQVKLGIRKRRCTRVLDFPYEKTKKKKFLKIITWKMKKIKHFLILLKNGEKKKYNINIFNR